MPDTSVPPCVPLVPLKLLPQCWSSVGVSLRKLMCEFFKRNCLGLQKFLPLNPCWCLQPDVWGLMFLALEPLAGGAWCGAGTPCSQDIPPKFIYLFVCLFSNERKKERERNNQCVFASHVAPTGDLVCNPGMCPD